jgi:hypothetical protein
MASIPRAYHQDANIYWTPPLRPCFLNLVKAPHLIVDRYRVHNEVNVHENLHAPAVPPSEITVGRAALPTVNMNAMSRYASAPAAPSRATPAASSTKLFTTGRESPERHATDKAVNVHAAGGGAKARVLGDRDEVAQVPQFDVHREHNPNRRASKANGQEQARISLRGRPQT